MFEIFWIFLTQFVVFKKISIFWKLLKFCLSKNILIFLKMILKIFKKIFKCLNFFEVFFGFYF